MIKIECGNDKPNTTLNSEYDQNDKEYMGINEISSLTVNKLQKRISRWNEDRSPNDDSMQHFTGSALTSASRPLHH